MAQITIRDMSYNTNNQIELVFTGNVTGPLVLVTEDPKEFFNPTTNKFDPYAFLFWNVDGKIITTTTATATAPNKPEFTCSAWYIKTGIGNGGRHHVIVSAFAANHDEFLSDIPIDSVTPPAAWVPGSPSVDTETAAVAIVVLGSVSGDPGAVFDGFVQNGGTVTGKELAVPKGVSDFAIVIYGDNPCQELIDEVDRIGAEIQSCVDFQDCSPRTIAALKQQLGNAVAKLFRCQKDHGL